MMCDEQRLSKQILLPKYEWDPVSSLYMPGQHMQHDRKGGDTVVERRFLT